MRKNVGGRSGKPDLSVFPVDLSEQEDRLPDHLDPYRARPLRDDLSGFPDRGRTSFLYPDLDQFMAVQISADRLEESVGDAFLADHDHRLEVVPEGTEISDLFSSKSFFKIHILCGLSTGALAT